jgi:Amt family ammonium transporter
MAVAKLLKRRDARVAERISVEDAIHQAFHDPLTGLPNRLLLQDRLELALARASRSNRQVAILFIDLDAFKNVNDSLGHNAGDELLADAATRLLDCIRATDTAARFGGDEFIVLLEAVNEQRVARVANRILAVLERPFTVQGREVFISASIGIAVGERNPEELLRNADLALYRAKRRGKARKQVFEPEMHAAVADRLELEGNLARALRGDELALHYQPIVDLRSGALVGIEALVRWRHPERGLLMPDEFVPVAEDSRLMAPLGRWVLTTACRQVAAWRGEQPSLQNVNVNLSVVELGDDDLVEQVQDTLAESRLEPERLVLELTEKAFLSHDEAILDQLERLKRLGLRLAVDDFGTVNASLRHLVRFPVDALKIDRSFIDKIVTDRRQAAIARSIIDLGRNLELEVIAEGIETAAQARSLLELGCVLGQGYHLGPPMEPEELIALVDRTWDDGGKPRSTPAGVRATPTV